jgi:hypothetical protein
VSDWLRRNASDLGRRVAEDCVTRIVVLRDFGLRGPENPQIAAFLQDYMYPVPEDAPATSYTSTSYMCLPANERLLTHAIRCAPTY